MLSMTPIRPKARRMACAVLTLLMICLPAGRAAAVTPGALACDYNLNGVCDAADYTVWRDLLGTHAVLPNRDPSISGPINQHDYNIWKTNFGSSIGSGSLASSVSGHATPEPTSAALLAAGWSLLALNRHGRRR